MPIQGILSLFGALLGLSFLAACQSTRQRVDYLQVALINIESGDSSLADGNFSEALSDFETALQHAVELDDQPEMIEIIRSKIRETKALSLLRHFESMDLKDPTAVDLLPVTMESKDYVIMQNFGEVTLHQKWVPRKVGDGLRYFGTGRKITVFPKSGIEVHESESDNQIVRVMGPAGFLAKDNGSWELYSGIFLFSGKASGPDDLIIDFPLGSVSARSAGKYSFILEITTNGGCKLIGLVGNVHFILQNNLQIKIMPGELAFVMKEKWSRKMNVELTTLMASSYLFSGFQDPPAWSKNMRQQALIQALRTKKHYRALVGDAKTLEEFEVRILEEDEVQKQLSE